MEPRGHACALRVTLGILATTARLQKIVQHLLTQQRMGVTEHFIASTVVILVVRPERALAQIVILVSEE